ncbi:MAG: ABC transporter permease [Bacilli bacterium]
MNNALRGENTTEGATSLTASRSVRIPYMTVSLAILLLLLVINTVLEPNLWSAAILAATLASAAPLLVAAVAETPVIILGNGSLDISVGPLMSVINVSVILLVEKGYSSPVDVIGLALLVGLASGLLNGLFVSILRLQPIVVTFATYTIYSGLATHLLSQPGGSVPQWLANWTGSLGPVPNSLFLVLTAVAVWYLLSRTRFIRNIYAIGGDERASYVSGVPIALVRLSAFALTGLFVALASLLLTAEIASGDGNIGTPFTLLAIASVALGGTSLLGGRGGIIGSLVGALDIILIDNVITVAHIPVFWQDVVYGLVLVVAIVINSLIVHRGKRRAL